jgi:hypothetical protein
MDNFIVQRFVKFFGCVVIFWCNLFACLAINYTVAVLKIKIMNKYKKPSNIEIGERKRSGACHW